MGGMLGGRGTISTSEPMIGALRVQTSAYGMAVPIVYGRTRIPANLIWYGDFTPIAHTATQSMGGKGGGGTGVNNTTYSYQTALAMGLCEGQINSIGAVWRGKTQYADRQVAAQTLTVQAEQNTVPISLPYQITVTNASNFSSNQGVTDAGGTPFSDVSPLAPSAAGQYSRNGGTYTFHSSDAGRAVRISYQYIVPAHAETGLSQLGLSLFTGAVSQAPWGYLTSKHPTEAIGYSGLAYVASGSYDLGSNAGLDNHNFEVDALLPFSSTIRDCNPKEVLVDFLTHVGHGAGFPAGKLGDLTAYSNWCVANGLFVSPVYAEQREAQECIQELVEATGAGIVYSDGLFKIIPYGDAAITGNGVTYTPSLSPQYDLTDDDFLGDGDPIQVYRSPGADAFNLVQVEFANRANQYNLQVQPAKDQADIETFGLRPEAPQKRHFFTEQSAAQVSAQLRLQRKLYIRNTYEFRLGWRYARLEPMDIVTLTDPGLGLVRSPVRIIEIDENEEGELSVKAEELPIGVASVAIYGGQGAGGYGSSPNAQPGAVQAPLIFEPPLALSGGRNEVWMAAAGLSANWGGANVWVSFDGTSYQRIGSILGPARYGVLNTSIAAPIADPDTTNPAVVDLNTDGQLLSGSQADVDSAATLCYVGGELLSYKAATLSASRRYSLSYLRRGLYGSLSGFHPAGATFARIDQAIFKYAVPATLVGKTIYLKLTSIDAYGKMEQNLGAVSAFSYTVLGGLPAGPANLSLQSPFVGTAFTVQWSPVAGAASYPVEIWSQGVKRRSVSTMATAMTYTLESATGDGGPWRDFTVKVATVANGQTSAFSQFNITNPVPAVPAGIATSSTANSITISWAAVADVDLQDYQVWLDTTNGFTPGAGNLKYTGVDLTTTITGLASLTTYYLKVAARDKWGAGALNYSVQIAKATP